MNQKTKPLRYYTITLCGSLKFQKDFLHLQVLLERKGHVCFSITIGENKIKPKHYEKSILDKVHFKKIMMSDCIIVINRKQYIGESTANEIEFAELNNKPVYYLFIDDFTKNGLIEQIFHISL